MEDRLNVLSTQELEERFTLLATESKEYALYLVSSAGIVLCWNPGAERLFGYRSDEVIGQHFSRFFTPEDVRSGQPEHELHVADEAGRSDSLCWQIRQDGTRFWCQAIVTPLLNEQKRVRSFARVMHDLTDRQAMTAERLRGDGLAAANRNKEEFMALLSHELRSPMSPIVNALSILRQMKTNDPIIETAGQIIDRQVTRMVRLVDDLLDISRITQGKLRLAKERADLRTIVNDAAQTARPLMEARKHDFSVVLPTERISVDVDPARMEQVIVNLLNNAAKYTDEGGLIRLTVSREADEGVVRVQDNGIGIDASQLPKIFDLFSQVDGSMGRSYGGLGIGLALARNLVEMQSGRIVAKSQGLGRGSEFSVKLPSAVENADPPVTVVVTSAANAGRSLRVLVVEDSVDAADSLSMLLRLYGHEVRVARTGPTALELASAFLPNIVLLDIGLPGMDGYEVARRLRNCPDFQNVKICAVTGYTPSESDRSRQQELGFDHYFVKPLTIPKLMELFKTVTQLPEAL